MLDRSTDTDSAPSGVSSTTGHNNHGPDEGDAITFRKPSATDGPAITELIAACPPLDANSAYCNLLQCTHFADHCVVAEQDGHIIGWVSGYRPPSTPDDFFVWQVAVAPEGRGKGLARSMILDLLARPAASGVGHLITTVTADNAASWSLFEGVARCLGAPLDKSVLFDRETHFGGNHATEWQARIGPFSRARNYPGRRP